MATFPSSDASSPPVVKWASAGVATTAQFSPPANSVIVISASSDGTGTTAMGLTNTGGLTFNLVMERRFNNPAGAEEGRVALWWAAVGSSPPTNMTVSLENQESTGSLPQMLIARVYTADQVDVSDPIGAVVGGNLPNTSSWSQSITPETSGGGLRAVYLDWAATGIPTTFQANTELVDGYHVAGLSTNVQIGKQTPTVAGVAETIGNNSLGTFNEGTFIVYELRAAPQPVAAYAMDENTGTLIADNGGSGRNLTRGTAIWATGRHGSGLTGVDSGAGATGAPFPAGTYTEFSIVVDVKLNSVEGNFSSIVENPTNTSLYLEIDEGGIPDAFVRGTSGGTALATAPSALTPGTWYTLAATFTNTGTTNNMRLYRDGVQVATGNRTSDLTAVALGGATLSVAGSVLQPSGATIDNLRFYSTALTAGQVAALTNTAVGGGGQQPVTGPAFADTAFDSATFYTSDATGVSSGATLAGTGAISSTGVLGKVAAAVLAGSVALASAGVVARSSSSSLAGTGAISSSGQVSASSTSTVAGAGGISAAGQAGRAATATLAGSGSLSSAGQVAAAGSGSVAGVGSLTAAGQVGSSRTALLAGSGSLTAAGQVGISSGAAGLVGIGVIGAAGSSVTGYQGQASPVAGVGSLTADGIMARGSGATVAGTGALAAAGLVGRSGGATRPGTGSVTATGTVGARASTSLAGSASLTSSGTVARAAGASLAGTGSLVATGSSVAGLLGVASRAGIGVLSVSYVLGRTSPTSIPGAGSLAAAGSVGRSTSASTTGVGSLSSSGQVGARSSSALAGQGTLEADGLVATRSSASVAGSGSLAAIGIVEEAGFARVTITGLGSLVVAGQVVVVDIDLVVAPSSRRVSATGGRRVSGSVTGRSYSAQLGDRQS